MNTRTVLRYELDVGIERHTLPAGKIVLFCEYRRTHNVQRRGRVEVWVEATLESPDPYAKIIGTQTVQVFGTGNLIREGATHLASTLDGPMVWHLYQLPAPPKEG